MTPIGRRADQSPLESQEELTNTFFVYILNRYLQLIRKHSHAVAAVAPCFQKARLYVDSSNRQKGLIEMSNDPHAITPPYVRVPLAAWLAQVSRAEFYSRLRAGRYRSRKDGKIRLIETASIWEDQERLGLPAAKISVKPQGKATPEVSTA